MLLLVFVEHFNSFAVRDKRKSNHINHVSHVSVLKIYIKFLLLIFKKKKSITLSLVFNILMVTLI